MVSIRNTNDTKAKRMSAYMVLWVYTYALFYFVPLIIPSTTLLMYIWLIILDILIVINYRFVSKSVIYFLGVYLSVTLINTLVVSYRYYVIVDAISGFMVFLPALLLLCTRKFSLDDFFARWRKVAIFATLFSPVAVILVQNKVIDYGVFTYLNLPNSLIFSLGLILSGGRKWKLVSLVMSSVNIMIILVFGGRMAAFAAAFSLLLSYMLSSKIEKWKKILLVIFIGVAGILLVSNLVEILTWAQFILAKYNLNSRSLSLFMEQIKTSNFGIYLSRREIVYDAALRYIYNRSGRPGGFGVILNITNGAFYHPHNLILQLIIMLGGLGTVIFFLFTFIRIYNIKHKCSEIEYKFTIYMAVEYLLISLTGGSILTNFVAILAICMIFFYNQTSCLEKYETRYKNGFKFYSKV